MSVFHPLRTLSGVSAFDPLRTLDGRSIVAFSDRARGGMKKDTLLKAVALASVTAGCVSPVDRQPPGVKNQARFAFTSLDTTFAYCLLKAEDRVPAWATGGEFTVLVREPGATSVLAPTAVVPPGVDCWRGVRVIRQEPLVQDAVGVIASITSTLASAGVSLEVVATRRTTYVLVAANDLAKALDTLRRAGHQVL